MEQDKPKQGKSGKIIKKGTPEYQNLINRFPILQNGIVDSPSKEERYKVPGLCDRLVKDDQSEENDS